MHTVNIAIAISRDDAKVLEDTATELNRPPYFMSNNSHPGTLPMAYSYLDFNASSTVLSAVLPTEENNVIHIRFYENGGKDDTVTLRFPATVSSAVATDLNGKEVPSDLILSGNEIILTAKANSIGQIAVRF